MPHLLSFIESFGVTIGTSSACHRLCQHLPKYTGSFAPSPSQSMSKVPVGHMNIQKPQAHPLVRVLCCPGHIGQSPACRSEAPSARVQVHTTKEADTAVPLYVYCFQGNSTVESKVILSGGLMVTLCSRSVMQRGL